MVWVAKNPPSYEGNIREVGSIFRSGRFPGGGQGNPLQYSCLEKPIDRGAWQSKVHWVTESGMTEWLSTYAALYVKRKKKRVHTLITNNLMLISASHHLNLKQVVIFLLVEDIALMLMVVNRSGWWLLNADIAVVLKIKQHWNLLHRFSQFLCSMQWCWLAF